MAGTRRLLIPEVIQTSAMDCGPAALKALFDGFNLPVSYGRLREACQTDIDGTSIDVLEELAGKLGMDAVQVVLPLDQVLMPETKALPALAVVRLADSNLHFIVIWRRWGNMVQIMDPALGRRWVSVTELMERLYVHALPVPAEGFRAWASTEEFLAGMRLRLGALADKPLAERLLAEALADETWKSVACLDAAARLVQTLVDGGGVERGESSERFLEQLLREVRAALAEGRAEQVIPASYWTAVGPPDAEEVTLRGVVAILARGLRTERAEGEPPLSAELLAALKEPPTRPLRELVALMRRDGVLAPSVLAAIALTAAVGGFLEALLLRGIIDAGRYLTTQEQRLAGIVTLLALMGMIFSLEFPLSLGTLRLGRRLELRLRLAFLDKIPRLGDRYFKSRLVSDMAQRCHGIHQVRSVPTMAVGVLRASAEMLVTLAGLTWLAPGSAPLIIIGGGLALAVPLLAQRSLLEADRRMRDFDGVLSRFYLDAMRGAVALRAHRAELTLRRAHEEPLHEFVRAARTLLSRGILTDTLATMVATGGSVAIVLHAVSQGIQPGAVLLLVYWALALATLGKQLADALRQYPAASSLTARMMEPLLTPDEVGAGLETADDVDARAETGGVGFTLKQVEVKAAGFTVLQGIDMAVRPGEHVAIVGPSGAGKSSLVGILLGWHRPSSGSVEVDGAPLAGQVLARLRRQTAWVEPEVTLWNKSLVDNLAYGVEATDVLPRVGQALRSADLIEFLDKLPLGLQTRLGEGGSLLSGGQGQRVRLGRALLRPGVRLAIFDEPFRGLERDRRAALLERSRAELSGATLLCIMHDIAETLTFDRVLVIKGGQLVEDDNPKRLAQREDSVYRALLDEEEQMRRDLTGHGGWRRMVLDHGLLSEHPAEDTKPMREGAA
ncbi:ATP-binding cassette domain-containing protein [Myxococcus sp. CA051A]|uniref:ATP-binding cassette domain-containing protein n=1 Tax=unclassified Myxococcus TaxID=2648731 RepID=UPI00157B3A9A|nr:MULTISPECIES: ATP-binding cassette domain-containing protein [unclassified Myxococcus]NTX15956.1 ATP-binding cassette domain-containing protein [Myxococcus sp. CA056]NTX67466.1 ATP-binding cassette domain-containing protein [Myxococcus sp. CA051A]